MVFITVAVILGYAFGRIEGNDAVLLGFLGFCGDIMLAALLRGGR